MFSIDSIMKSDVMVVTPQNMVKDVINLMGKHRVSGLCVVDDLVQRHVVGVISEFDILKAFKEFRTHERVSKLMTTEVTTVCMETTLDELLDIFLAKRYRRVFVADKGVLRGVISRRDVVYAAQCREQVNRFAEMSKKQEAQVV